MDRNVMKRFGAIILAAVFLCPVLGGCGKQGEEGGAGVPDYEYVFRKVGEQKYIEPAESFAGGNGTESDPYQISNAAELALLGEVYEILAETHDISDERVKLYYQAHFILTADIVINERADGEDWSKTPPQYAWIPIGFHRNFEGVFDGAGHTVRGLYINADVVEENASSGNSFGLFGENGGTIKNVVLEKSYICVGGYTSHIGGIAGRNRLEGNLVENCRVSAELYCYDSECGGVVGSGRGAVKDCAFSGTVTCLREDGNGSRIGGIVGFTNGAVTGCQNSGTVTHLGVRMGKAGGIAGEGTSVTDCENTGSVIGGQVAGGIVGSCSLVSGGGDLEIKGADIVNCQNSGSVKTDGEYAGGIAGTIEIDYSGYTATVSGCENKGSVEATEKIGGVIGILTLMGEGGVTVNGCTNSADLDGEVVGGIIGSSSDAFGTLVVTDCKNHGEIHAGLYGAGITAENNLMTWEEDKAYPLNVTVSGCENTGTVTTVRGGGVAGVFVSSIPEKNGGRVILTLDNCVNNADLYCTQDGSFIGGIAGNVGVAGGAVTVKDCRCGGAVIYPTPDGEETTDVAEEGLSLEVSRIAGGIVGMVDSGIFLATDNDGTDASQVNNPDAKIVFTGCHSDMTFHAPGEDEAVYDDGTPVFFNRFGGIIGFCSDDAGLAFRVENCTYTGCDRGLGVAELPDVGARQ